jgi:hypothetical protein
MSEGWAEPLVSLAQTSHADRFHSQFANINIVDCLNLDARLNFVLELKENNPVGSLVFCNPALSGSSLHDPIFRIFSQTDAYLRQEEDVFAGWIMDQTTQKGVVTSKVFFGTLWTVTLILPSWAVISGVELAGCDLQTCDALSR